MSLDTILVIAPAAAMQPCPAHDGPDVAGIGPHDPEAGHPPTGVQAWLRRHGQGGAWAHGRTPAGGGDALSAVAQMARRIGWRLPLSAAAVAAMTLAFMYVLTMGTHQSDLRHRARASLEAEAARCESLQSHGDRALCRAALHALPRDSADIVAWTPRDR